MTTYKIGNTVSGHMLGEYNGDTLVEAFNAMAKDAGYRDIEDMLQGETLEQSGLRGWPVEGTEIQAPNVAKETTWIANDVQINVESIEELCTNSKTGDARVTLCVADGVDGNRWPFLRTNGNPIVITEAGGSDSCDIDAAAESLGLTRDELISMVKASSPGIDW